MNLIIALLVALLPAPMLPSVLSAVLPACVTEDSASCYWDAAHRGNGLGRSFVALTDGTVIYLPESRS